MMRPAFPAIVGVGRLGAALASCLGPGIWVTDIEIDRARAVARSTGAAADHIEAIMERSDYLLVAVPPDVMAPLATAYAQKLQPDTVWVNLATSVKTEAVANALGRDDVEVIGCKPVAQARAIEVGFPGVFVTACKDPVSRQRLAGVIAPAGALIVGNEDEVAGINARATRAALAMARVLEVQLAGVPGPLVAASIKSVVVGTLLDYPEDLSNPYLQARLNELEQTP